MNIESIAFCWLCFIWITLWPVLQRTLVVTMTILDLCKIRVLKCMNYVFESVDYWRYSKF